MNSIFLEKPLVALVLLITISSCTLTKRRYSKGFHVDWFAHHKHQPVQNTVPQKFIADGRMPATPCDTILRKGGDTILSAKTTVDHSTVKIISCRDADSTHRHLDLSTIDEIRFEGGEILRYTKQKYDDLPSVEASDAALPAVTAVLGLIAIPNYLNGGYMTIMLFAGLALLAIITLIFAYDSGNKRRIKWAWIAAALVLTPMLVALALFFLPFYFILFLP